MSRSYAIPGVVVKDRRPMAAFFMAGGGWKERRQKRLEQKRVGERRVGPRLPPGPVLGWKREAFQGFCVFCGCPSVLHFSQINVLFLSLHFQGLS